MDRNWTAFAFVFCSRYTQPMTKDLSYGALHLLSVQTLLIAHVFLSV